MNASEFRRHAAAVLLGAALSGCGLLTPLPETATLAERLGAMPTLGLPLDRPVVIHWNEHQVPFIEAESDDDLAVALGLVHAHLRLGQMEILRRVAQGRVSEMAGPLTVDLDHTLRALDLGRAVPEIVAAMPEETRRWLESFVRGINHYLAQAETLPHEFAVLGLRREPWDVADVLTIGRLASVDINWLVWRGLLKLRERPDWPDLWARLVKEGSASMPSFEEASRDAALGSILSGFGRSGSDSLAVSPARSASGAALIASDPHLGISVPNYWLVAGYKSPSFHAVGLMIPGLPFVAMGRNPWIAWGGTNMHAASSDLYDVSGLPEAAFTERQETVATRWWFDKRVAIRDTEFGPVISDAPLFEAGEGQVLALRWVGHRPSDEMTALLKVNRARNWREFRDALRSFAVPGENVLYADGDGHVGQVVAARLPRRRPGAPADLVLAPGDVSHWESFVTGDDLPFAFDPPGGFLASANNRPAETDVPVGFFFSPDDRIRRLTELLAENSHVSVADLAELQRDVYMASAVELRDALLDRMPSLPIAASLTAEQQSVLESIAAWDGHYREDSAGAAAFELMLYYLLEAFYADEGLPAYAATWRPRALIREDVGAAAPEALSAALDQALGAAARDVGKFGTWGEMHRLRLAHPLRLAPLIGRRYRFGDYPASGGSETILKTAHGFTAERHFARYGSVARHISDLSDLDENYFVLLGGQDGWINGTTFIDQFDLWRRGEYLRVPMRPATVHATFQHRMQLSP